MKKVLFILALVAAYGVSVSTASAKVLKVEKAQITVVADTYDSVKDAPEGEKEKAKTKEAKAAKSEGCSGTKAKAKSEGCAGTKAKSEGCASKKAKSDCSSSCSGEKSKKTE